MSNFDSTIIVKAIQFAIKKHKGQKRDSGEDFMVHPIGTATLMKIVAPDDTNLIAASYLHDTLEDTQTTYEELVKEFNQDIADLVKEVTKYKPDPQKAAYFPNLKTQRGILLKFCDRINNISDFKSWSKQKQEWYLRTSKFWRASMHDGHRNDDMAWCYDCNVMLNEDGTEKEEKKEDLIRLIAELLQNIEVPRSLGVIALGKGVESYDAIFKNLHLSGWKSADEIEQALRENLHRKEVTDK